MLVAALVGLLAAMTLTGTAGAAQASEGARHLSAAAAPATDGFKLIGVGPAATCRYEVNHFGGIYIYEVNAVGAYWGSLANGATFDAACNNGEGESYTDCVGGTSRLWKAVNAGGGNTGYVKTKCLVRL